MTRSRWLLLAAAVATSAVGCAHCGVQDEMPAPCVAGGCADCGGMIAPAQPAMPPPMVLGSPTLMMMPAPPVIQSSPTAPAGGSAPANAPAPERAAPAPAGGSSVPEPLPLPGGGAPPFSPPNSGANPSGPTALK